MTIFSFSVTLDLCPGLGKTYTAGGQSSAGEELGLVGHDFIGP